MPNRSISKKIVLLVGRDNWHQDDSLNHVLLQHLAAKNIHILWEDPAGNLIYNLYKLELNFKFLNSSFRKLIRRAIQIIYAFFHWNYFIYLWQNNSITNRTIRLKKRILSLGSNKEIFILSRSSGGRISSLIADELPVKHLICIGYPFKHPDKNDEPDRYEHLKNLQTPFLIIQGTNDEYGGLEVTKNYTLSSRIELFFTSANHNFEVNKSEWDKVLEKIDDIIENKINEDLFCL